MPMSTLDEVQMVKSWMREYGYYILFSIVVFLAANFGWRYWQQYKYTRTENASIIYGQMLEASSQKKDAESKLFGEKLIKSYAKSIQASLAALVLAKNYVDADDLKSAQDKLQFVIKKSPSKEIRDLARVRLGRVLIARKEPQKAIDLLASSKDDSAYAVLINEVRGDALLKLGKNTEAEKAYRRAKILDEDASSPLLKMKLQQF